MHFKVGETKKNAFPNLSRMKSGLKQNIVFYNKLLIKS